MVLIWFSAQWEKKFQHSYTVLYYRIRFSKVAPWERSKRTPISRSTCHLVKTLSVKLASLTEQTNAVKLASSSFGKKSLKVNSQRRRTRMQTERLDFCKAWQSTPTKRLIICVFRRTRSSSSIDVTLSGRSVLRANRQARRNWLPIRPRKCVSALPL